MVVYPSDFNLELLSQSTDDIQGVKVDFGEGEPLFSKIFEWGTDVVNVFLINDQKAVMRFGECFYINGRILSIVFK